jgi:hypothetical protein
VLTLRVVRGVDDLPFRLPWTPEAVQQLRTETSTQYAMRTGRVTPQVEAKQP